MFASFQSSGRQPNLSDLLNNSEYRQRIISLSIQTISQIVAPKVCTHYPYNFWNEEFLQRLSKVLSNILVTLTSPLTHVKDEVKGMVAVTTLLMLVKDELRDTNTLHSQS